VIWCGAQKKDFDLGHAKRISRVIMNNDTTHHHRQYLASSFISSNSFVEEGLLVASHSLSSVCNNLLCRGTYFEILATVFIIFWKRGQKL
jgi:hypothetical protein